MENGYAFVLGGCIAVFYGLYGILVSNYFFVFLWILISGTHLIIAGYFYIQGYINKTYFLASFILYGLLGLDSMYVLLFVHSTNYPFLPYIFPGMFVIFVPFLIRDYLHRNVRFMPIWKNEW